MAVSAIVAKGSSGVLLERRNASRTATSVAAQPTARPKNEAISRVIFVRGDRFCAVFLTNNGTASENPRKDFGADL